MFGSATSKIRGATSVGKAVVVLLVVGFAAGTLTCANGQEYASVGSDDKGPPVGSTDINPNAMQAPTKSPIDECSDDPSCRLEVTSEQLHGLYGSTNQWIPLDSTEIHGGLVFSWISIDEQTLIRWYDKNGVVYVGMLVAAPYAFNTWPAPSPEADVRYLLSQVIPAWESDHAAFVITIWHHYGQNPAFQDQRPASVVKGIVMEMYYMPRVSAVGVRLWTHRK